MKRVFTSFAKEDEQLRNYLVTQSKNDKSPFEFVDMSVKQPWDNNWKTNCRTKIKGCDGMIAIITKNSKNADGQLWEIKCAIEEGIPVERIYGHKDHTGCSLPNDCPNITVKDWTWDNLKKWIDKL